MALFTVPQMIQRLTRGFVKMMGREPDGLEKIKIRLEALEKVKQQDKVVDMEGKVIDTSKGIMGGKQIQDSPEFGAKIRETYDAAQGPGKGQEMIDALKSPGAKKSYEILEKQLGIKLYGDETFEEVMEIQRTGKHPRGEPKAEGGIMRLGFKDGPKLSDFLNIQAEGSKTGEQQIAEGITMDNETYNFIVNADIPIGEKINLLTKYGRGKGRTRIEKDDQELFLGEGGSRTREIGVDFNPDAEKGFSGNIMYNPDSNDVRGGITYKFNEGGRAGFKDGMTRRTFLKFLAGAASIPIVGKILKPMKIGKTVTKVPMIKTDNVAGKPEWFDALVNKVIIEGDDVTKKFATQERQIVHSKDLGDGTTVRVTQDMDQGAVRVEYDSPDNVFEDTVQMEYKKPLPDEGDPRPSAEFTTAESGPVGRQTGPDDYDIDVDEVGGTSIRDLDSDVSKLKEYATGKKPTMKELVQNIERRKKAQRITEGGDEMIDAVTRRQGDYDPYASGGIARMLGE